MTKTLNQITKGNKHMIKLHHLNKTNASDSIYSFKLGLMIVIKNPSIFLHVLAFDEALHNIFHVK